MIVFVELTAFTNIIPYRQLFVNKNQKTEARALRPCLMSVQSNLLIMFVTQSFGLNS